MNTPHPALIPGVIALLAIPLHVLAAEQSHRCAGVNDDAQRLACYDAAYGKPSRAAAAVAPTTATAAAPVEMRTAVAEKQPKRDAAEVKAAARPTRQASTVADLKRMRDGRFEATLRNGEVWAQLEPDLQVEVRVGDDITIRPAMLGSFLLVAQSGATTRVKRVR